MKRRGLYSRYEELLFWRKMLTNVCGSYDLLEATKYGFKKSFGYQICNISPQTSHRKGYNFEAVVSFQHPTLECKYVVQIQLYSCLR